MWLRSKQKAQNIISTMAANVKENYSSDTLYIALFSYLNTRELWKHPTCFENLYTLYKTLFLSSSSHVS